MKHFATALILLTMCSCGNERVLQLPEIENAEITEVLDVSAAYIFYDESQADSTLLNRKNLIGTTNWLVNVDKRLTLAQAIPKITYLQNKKRNAKMHKNENAKNYFTCNDTSIKNLGFIEFTDVYYHTTDFEQYYQNELKDNLLSILLEVKTANAFKLTYLMNEDTIVETFGSFEAIKSSLKARIEVQDHHQLHLKVFSNLTFQDYIDVKSMLEKLKTNGLKVDQNEFIY